MSLPVGYHRFHPDTNLNFQLNRLVADGTPEMLAEVTATSPRLRDFVTWHDELRALSDRAWRESRLRTSCAYLRAASFFLPPAARRAPYDEWRERIDEAWMGEFTREVVASQGAKLPLLRLEPPPARGFKGTIVFFGGFDSYIEEFLPAYAWFRDAGYRVFAFDGPGQGDVLIRQGIPMTPDWESPVSAVLDHTGARDVTLIGISLGGCLAIRAAAREPRVSRVVAFDILSDFFACVASRRGRVGEVLLRAGLAAGGDVLLDKAIHAAMRVDKLTAWGIEQGMFVTGAGGPSAFLRQAMRYQTADRSCEVEQDVLLLAGEDDHFVPLEQLAAQRSSLTGARSVSSRVFTAAESAAAHVQMGNLPLAFQTIARWVD